MSIRVEIQRQIIAGEVVRVLPALRSTPVVRSVVVSRDIYALLQGPWGTAEETQSFSKLRADLDSFISGAPVSVAEKPRRSKKAFLKRLEGERGEIWEIRQVAPKPGIRILGGFAEQDVFVGLVWRYRPPLDDYGSAEWREAIQTCKHTWRRLFLTWPPVGSTLNTKAAIHEYLSGNFLFV
jgi:hypothetical protein